MRNDYRITWAARRLARLYREELKRGGILENHALGRRKLIPRTCAALAVGGYPLSSSKAVLRAVLYASLHTPTTMPVGDPWTHVCVKALQG